MRRLILFATVLLITLIPAGSVSADDVVVNPGSNIKRENQNGIIWTSLDIGYLIYQTSGTASSAEIAWVKTVDGGSTWSTPVIIQADIGQDEPGPGFAVWFDRWTPGDIGTEIHIAFVCDGPSCPNTTANGLYYTSLDTANDSLSSTVTIGATATTDNLDDVSISKSVSGILYAFGRLGTTISTEQVVAKSINSGSTWTDIADPESSSGAFPTIKFAPAADSPVFLVSDDDMYSISGTSNEADVLQYDESSDTWITVFDWLDAGLPTPFITSGAGGGIARTPNSVSVATNSTSGTSAGSSGNVLNFYGVLTGPDFNDRDSFYVLRQNVSSTVTDVTPVFENITAALVYGGLTYIDSTDQLYAWYVNFDTDQVHYRVSDDSGDTWSAETRFDNTANAKGDISGTKAITRTNGRLMPIWEEGTALVTELDSVIEFETSPDVDEQEFPNKLDRFRAGLNLTGNTGEVAFALGSAFLLAVVTIAFGMPKILMVVLEFFWLTAMAMPPIEYLPAGIYLSAFLVMGVLFVFLLINTIFGSRTSGEDF